MTPWGSWGGHGCVAVAGSVCGVGGSGVGSSSSSSPRVVRVGVGPCLRSCLETGLLQVLLGSVARVGVRRLLGWLRRRWLAVCLVVFVPWVGVRIVGRCVKTPSVLGSASWHPALWVPCCLLALLVVPLGGLWHSPLRRYCCCRRLLVLVELGPCWVLPYRWCGCCAAVRLVVLCYHRRLLLDGNGGLSYQWRVAGRVRR